MKTLSNNLDISISTTGMAEGYVVTTIYANSIGVFTGHSYIPGNDSSLYINVNDIAAQNRGKDNYLKLNDEGQVKTVPLVNDTYETYSYQRRWNRGQVGEYKVTILGKSSADPTIPISNTNMINVLTGYDYSNRDLKPTSMDEEDSSLCRIMQGCDWIYNHDDEIGSFQNLLLPHYPLKRTDKYGVGLQIGVGNTPSSRPNTPYSIRRDMGPEIKLGSPIYGLSNTTFLTLKDLINGITGSNDNDSDVSIYLKQFGTSGDEFGDWIEGYTRYKRIVNLTEFLVIGYRDSEILDQFTYQSGTTGYNTSVTRYMAEVQTDWDANKLRDGEIQVFDSGWQRSESIAENMAVNYTSQYSATQVIMTQQEAMMYDEITIEPIFTYVDSTKEIPDEYIGTCPISILDRCYSRYYLAWNDRYGDIQSQPFEGKIEYTEDTQKTEIKDYKMRRRVIHNELQPKWKLNTKWLNEDVYPIYESIFISPYLLLYDTQTDRSWNVILTDNKYTEKTYKSQKRLFNLEITVEANTKENRIF